MPDHSILVIEKCVANAHNNVYRAALLAESLKTQSLADDLHQLAVELSRLQVELLTGNVRRRSSVT